MKLLKSEILENFRTTLVSATRTRIYKM